jgi:hypothetical protein
MPTNPPVATVSPSRINRTASAAVTTFPFSEVLRYGNAGCCGISSPPHTDSVMFFDAHYFVKL